jgi:hypothetical protein
MLHTLVRWLAPLTVLVCLILPPWSAWTALALSGVAAACVTAGAWQAGSFLRRRRDPGYAEEAAARKRLTALRTRVDQIEVTLRDLRSLQFGPHETIRARWAEVDLDEALRPLRRAMARERALLFSLEAARWIYRVEPLLLEIGRLNEPGGAAPVRDRLYRLRDQGAELLARLQSDSAAGASSLGTAVLALLRQALEELERLEQAPAASREPVADAEGALGRLRDLAERLRAPGIR